MLKVVAFTALFANLVCAQEVAFSQPEDYWEEPVEEVRLEDQEASEEIGFLEELEEDFLLEE
jgi:hypothetical protein